MSSISSIFSIAGNGLTAAGNQLTRTGQSIVSPNGLDNLVQNAVDLSTEKTDFSADVMLLKTANKMTGTLLDILDTDPK